MLLPALLTRSLIVCSTPRNLRRESGLFFTPVLILWGGRHIAGHIWRQVIVPSDVVQSFGMICVHKSYCVIHHKIMCQCDLVHMGKETHACLAGIDTKKSGGTITLLHAWPQDGYHNRFPPQISLVLPKLSTSTENLNFTKISHMTCKLLYSHSKITFWKQLCIIHVEKTGRREVRRYEKLKLNFHPDFLKIMVDGTKFNSHESVGYI